METGIYIYTKKGCPFCEHLKEDLRSLGLDFEYLELDPQDENYLQKAKQVKDTTHMTTFPILYVGKTRIGGYSDFRRQILGM